MKLSDWSFHILDEPAEEGSYADISCAEKRKAACIRVCPEFFELDEDEQRHTICHELIHCHLHPVHAAAMDLECMMARDAYRMFYARFLESLEYAVDALADAASCDLPLMKRTIRTKRGKSV